MAGSGRSFKLRLLRRCRPSPRRGAACGCDPPSFGVRSRFAGARASRKSTHSDAFVANEHSDEMVRIRLASTIAKLGVSLWGLTRSSADEIAVNALWPRAAANRH